MRELTDLRPKDVKVMEESAPEKNIPVVEVHLHQRLEAITDVAHTNLSLEALERDLLERVREVLEADTAMLLLLTQDGQYLELTATCGRQEGFKLQGERHILIPMGQGVAGRIAAERRPLTFPDLLEVEVLNPVLREHKVRSLVGAPLLAQGRLTGVIYVGTTQPHLFTAEDVLLMGLAAERLGVAIERSRYVEARREEEDRYSAILEAALDCIVIMDHRGLVTEFNPAAERTFGYTRAQAVGCALGDLIVPPSLRQQHWQGLTRYLESGQGAVVNKRIEITGMRSDGSEFPVELAIVPTRLDGNPLFIGYLRDITQRKRADEEREDLLAREHKAREEAETASRIKDEFLATLSHELRTPLTAIIGWAHLMGQGRLSEEAKANGLETIRRNAHIQAQLVEDLLDVSRIITGKMRLEARPTELSTIIEDAVASALPAAQSKEIRLQRVLDSGSTLVSGDPSRLQQVVWNLLSNAIKFTPKGGRVQVRLERVNSHIEIIVADTGAGIEPLVLPCIFERFRQADQTMTRNYGGLGLGLSIVRHIVEMHGGTVEVESRGAGQGATFTVKLPLIATRSVEVVPLQAEERVHPAARDGASKNEDDYACPAELQGLHVLVVDDDEDSRLVVRTVLESCAARVTTASSTAEGLLALRELGPDVVITDIGMPGEDGYSLIRKIRDLSAEQGGQTPAAALTAYARVEDRLKVLRSGFQTHLSKPVEPAELVAVVANLARRIRQ